MCFFSNPVSNIWDMWSVQQDFLLILAKVQAVQGLEDTGFQSQMFAVSWVSLGTTDDSFLSSPGLLHP